MGPRPRDPESGSEAFGPKLEDGVVGVPPPEAQHLLDRPQVGFPGVPGFPRVASREEGIPRPVESFQPSEQAPFAYVVIGADLPDRPFGHGLPEAALVSGLEVVGQPCPVLV